MSNTLVFGTESTHPEALNRTSALIAALARGATVAACEQRPAEWHEITVDAVDERFTAALDYSPLLAKCQVLETHLPMWLESVEGLLRRGGVLPDGEVILSIRRSVPELLSTPLRAPTTGWHREGTLPTVQ